MDKPTKPTDLMPRSFGGLKENFSANLQETGVEANVPVIYSGKNFNYQIDATGKELDYCEKICDFINEIPIGKTIAVDSNNKLIYTDYQYADKVSKTGDTMTGQLIINKENLTANSGIKLTGSKQNYAISILDTSITKGTAPSSDKNIAIDIYGKDNDNYNKRLGMLELKLQANNTCSVGIVAYNCTTNTNTASSKIEASVDGNGNAYTYAPTPTVSDNSTKIATTAYVNNYTRRTTMVEAHNNWNDFTEYGTYLVQNGTMDAAHNAPVGEYTWGLLDVLKSGAGAENRTVQIYYPHNSTISRIWTRMLNGTTWTTWIAMAHNSDVVHKAGAETITGAKTFTGNSVVATVKEGFRVETSNTDAYFVAKRTDLNQLITFGYGAGGSRGMWDSKHQKWAFNIDDAGNAQVLGKEIVRVKEKYTNGTSWYRVYTDNWCEQGTTKELSNGGSYTFLKAFKDTNYTILATPLGSPTGQSADNNWLAFPLSKSTGSCTFRVFDSDSSSAKTGNVNIIAMGYIS